MNGQQPLTREEVSQQVEQVNMSWVDQFNQHLLLTVQALQKLHQAFDRKFSR